jgi:hypothetical protein
MRTCGRTQHFNGGRMVRNGHCHYHRHKNMHRRRRRQEQQHRLSSGRCRNCAPTTTRCGTGRVRIRTMNNPSFSSGTIAITLWYPPITPSYSAASITSSEPAARETAREETTTTGS